MIRLLLCMMLVFAACYDDYGITENIGRIRVIKSSAHTEIINNTKVNINPCDVPCTATITFTILNDSDNDIVIGNIIAPTGLKWNWSGIPMGKSYILFPYQIYNFSINCNSGNYIIGDVLIYDESNNIIFTFNLFWQ